MIAMKTFTLKQIEGKHAGAELWGAPLDWPTVGEPIRFMHRRSEGRNIPAEWSGDTLVTSPVTVVTEKNGRIIARTENSVYALEQDIRKK